MENILLERTDMLGVFGIAMLRSDGPVDTAHLLISLASVAATREIMDTAQLTRTVLASVHKRRQAAWDGDDRGGPVGIVIGEGGEPADFTAAAADALRRAGTKDSPGVLLALLDDEDCRAAALLADCAAPVAALRESLRSGRPLRIADPVPRELHRVRDVMIGRTRYPRVPFWRNPLLAIIGPARPDLTPHPLAWLMLETREQARERGHRRPGTDDVLLALLAMYETARLYPHLYAHVAGEYAGAAALAEAGASYSTLRAANDDLGVDPRPLRKLVPEHPGNTRRLLDLLLDGDTRARRLLAAAGVNPS